eukprot:TRINITY_DN370_c0_g2_i1.p2 TRINITY_DN370_c0_g2~~TRINITY_DN370_c0_g2_i1.p2  ORF type:complete len:140 (-),score=18.00 TRINITY_DN370_c0_g2_i1:211-630(-)
MSFFRVSVLIAMLSSLSNAAVFLNRLRPKVSFAELASARDHQHDENYASDAANAMLSASLRNPNFSKDSCKDMFRAKVRLGTVSANEYVDGCGEVCEALEKVKTYWGSGDMASYACTHINEYGCVFDGTPPRTARDIGC